MAWNTDPYTSTIASANGAGSTVSSSQSTYQSIYGASAAGRGQQYRSNTNSTLNNADQNLTISKLFTNTKDFKDVTQYNLMRGVPDFGSLVQFNPFETGYACLIVCEMPKFIEMLAAYDTEYAKLAENWKHIIEFEFNSFSGIQDMSADTIQIGDDLNNINVINRVNMQSASEFTLSYDEKSGSPLTKFAKLYLQGIKDPRTQVKTYHGLIHTGLMEPGFENEVFTFLYIVTDNTMMNVEAAYLLIGCQLQSADTDMYNYTKGDIQKRTTEVRFSGYPITSSYIELAASDMINFLLTKDAGARQIVVNSMNYDYTGQYTITKTLDDYSTDATGGVADRSRYASTNYNTNNHYRVGIDPMAGSGNTP